MKTCKVTYFKPGGKYYTEETVELPKNTMPWHAVVKEVLRIKNMHAVYGDDAPWGYPHMVPSEYNQ